MKVMSLPGSPGEAELTLERLSQFAAPGELLRHRQAVRQGAFRLSVPLALDEGPAASQGRLRLAEPLLPMGAVPVPHHRGYGQDREERGEQHPGEAEQVWPTAP